MHPRLFSALCLLVPIIIGGIIRLYPASEAPFPINDGGMHYTLVQELLHNNFKLPHTSTYNQLNLPFVYPPLSTFVTAVMVASNTMTLLDALRLLPAFFASLTVLACWYLARVQCGPNILGASVATLFFAVNSLAVLQFIKGGGISRSIGLLFAILAVALFRRCQLSPSRLLFPLATGICIGLCILSHPEAATLMAFGILAAIVSVPVRKMQLRAYATSFGTAALVVAPWLLSALTQHGFAPFVAALGSAPSGFSQVPVYLIQFRFSPSLVLDGLALLGIAILLVRKQWFLPLWLILLTIFMHRGLIMVAPVILALLATHGIFDVLLPALHSERPAHTAPKRSKWIIQFCLFFLVVHSLSIGYGTLHDARTPTRSLFAGEHEAMQWVSSHSTPQDRFLILSGRSWADDAVSEWFPALTDRKSIVTCQGREWKSSAIFLGCLRFYDVAQSCLSAGPQCLLQPRLTNLGYEYVWISKGRSGVPPLFVTAIDQDSHFSKVYESETVLILKRASAA